jgi:hypothetical protein
MAIRVHLAPLLLLATLPLSAQTTPAPAPNANNVQASAQTLIVGARTLRNPDLAR